MLTNFLDGWFKIDLGEGAFYSVFGFIFVFLGIVVLIAIFTLLGVVMKKINAKPKRDKGQKKGNADAPSVTTGAPSAAEEGISPETVAVIAAAISAYYEQSREKCDFVVKRIKRL